MRIVKKKPLKVKEARELVLKQEGSIAVLSNQIWKLTEELTSMTVARDNCRTMYTHHLEQVNKMEVVVNRTQADCASLQNRVLELVEMINTKNDRILFFIHETPSQVFKRGFKAMVKSNVKVVKNFFRKLIGRS